MKHIIVKNSILKSENEKVRIKTHPQKNKKALENLVDWILWIGLAIILFAAGSTLYKLFQR